MSSNDSILEGTAWPCSEGDALIPSSSASSALWLGLHHSLEGGCRQGDIVSDTPAVKFSADGSPKGRNTRKQGASMDAVTNYMDHTSDRCMFEFTSGQADRMLCCRLCGMPNAGLLLQPQPKVANTDLIY
jgi:hypothetical protein